MTVDGARHRLLSFHSSDGEKRRQSSYCTLKKGFKKKKLRTLTVPHVYVIIRLYEGLFDKVFNPKFWATMVFHIILNNRDCTRTTTECSASGLVSLSFVIERIRLEKRCCRELVSFTGKCSHP